MPICSNCCNDKPLAAFSLREGGRPRADCKSCRSAAQNLRYAALGPAGAARQRERYAKDVEATRAKNRERTRRVAEKQNARQRERYARDAAYREQKRLAALEAYAKDPEAIKRRIRAYAATNAERLKPLNALRSIAYQTKRKKAIPPWADIGMMRDIYRQANALRRLGIDAQVDHEIPLRGKNVSGLHVHTNLQIILGDANRRKGNKFASG